MRSTGGMKPRLAAAIFATAAVLVVLAGCGGGGDSTSTATEAANEGDAGGASKEVAAKALAVAEKYKDLTKIGPTEPVGKPIPKDKYVIYVNCGQPACAVQGEAFEEAASRLGWKAETINVKLPTPPEIQAAFDEVIRRHPDAVSSVGFGPALYPQQLAKLNEMGVFIGESQGEVESGEQGVSFDPIGPEKVSEWMQLLANKTVADLGGEAEIGAVLLTGFPITMVATKAYVEEVENICPECTTKTLEVTPEAIGKTASGEITNFLRSNSGIEGLYLSYAALSSGLSASLQNAGIEAPKVYAWAPDPPQIEELQTGKLASAVADPYNEISWSIIDAMARHFVGDDEIQPFQEPIIWSQDFENVPEQAEPFPEVIPGFKEQYEKLWGLK